jgi:hypothetical protein
VEGQISADPMRARNGALMVTAALLGSAIGVGGRYQSVPDVRLLQAVGIASPATAGRTCGMVLLQAGPMRRLVPDHVVCRAPADGGKTDVVTLDATQHHVTGAYHLLRPANEADWWRVQDSVGAAVAWGAEGELLCGFGDQLNPRVRWWQERGFAVRVRVGPRTWYEAARHGYYVEVYAQREPPAPCHLDRRPNQRMQLAGADRSELRSGADRRWRAADRRIRQCGPFARS